MHFVSFTAASVSSRVVCQSRSHWDSEFLGEQPPPPSPASLGAPGGRASGGTRKLVMKCRAV